MEAIQDHEVRPLRRVEYDRLIALGEFQDERIELLYGALVAMTPIGPPHSSTVQKLMKLLVIAFGDRAAVRCQLPLAAGDLSEPEPDFTVVAPGEYDQDHPHETHVVIEVSDSSLRRDRGLKLRLYAECGVPEYWIVNLVDCVIEVYREPRGSEYAQRRDYSAGERIAFAEFPDIEIAVDDVIRRA